MKKIILTLTIGLLGFTAAHAQTVIVQKTPGLLEGLVDAAVAVVTPVPAVVPHAPAAIPTSTIITTHGDGTITTITRQASSYELGPIILTPVDPLHRVGPGPLVNPYVYRHR